MILNTKKAYFDTAIMKIHGLTKNISCRSHKVSVLLEKIIKVTSENLIIVTRGDQKDIRHLKYSDNDTATMKRNRH